MEVPRPKNATCTFSATGVCKCSNEVADEGMATEVSSQNKESIKGVAKK